MAKGGGPALDVAGRRGLVAGEEVAEVPLLVYEQFLVGQHHEGRVDGRVAVRVVLHARADDVGHLVELAVVRLEQRVQDAPLDGLEPVVQVRYGPVLDHVARVVEEIVVEELLDVCHVCPVPHRSLTRFFMM